MPRLPTAPRRTVSRWTIRTRRALSTWALPLSQPSLPPRRCSPRAAGSFWPPWCWATRSRRAWRWLWAPRRITGAAFIPPARVARLALPRPWRVCGGLEARAMAQALGIAGSQAAGSMEFLATGAWTKRFHPGWAAHNGLIAAALARQGFSGPETMIEGTAGLVQAYSQAPRPAPGTHGLGNTLANLA